MEQFDFLLPSENLQAHTAQRLLECALFDCATLRRTDSKENDKPADATKICTDLFADNKDPLKSIVPQAVVQGEIGNCYFLSALASLAQLKPEAIQKMIKDNGDGTYTVTFPGAPREPITVSKPTEKELQTYAHATEYGIWPAVLEKAYGAWCSKSVWRRNLLTNPFASDVAQRNADGGSMTHHGLRFLTGGCLQYWRWFNKETKAEEVGEQLQKAIEEKRPITVFTGIGKPSEAYLPSRHEYSVLGYDAKTRMVTIRNPWGNCEPTDDKGKPIDGKNDGIFKISLDDLVKKFHGVAIAEKSP
jgi:hypothetical protein